MNHIQRLTQERTELLTNRHIAIEDLQEFRAHLLSAKFQGVDADGDRKDWIATSDVLARLSSVLSTLQG